MTVEMKRVIVGIAMVVDDSKVLLMKRPDDAVNLPGKWVFPGGKAKDTKPGEPFESASKAAERECLEETGVPCEVERALFRKKKVFDAEPTVEYNCSFFVAKKKAGETGAGEGQPVQWATFHELSKLSADGDVDPTITEYLSQIGSIFADPHKGQKIE